ncbi:MAG: hypothetical protein NC127_07940 [Muribaculum sp.]|nr:hypothetical protein [Muribaculum sp.]
MNPSYNNSVSAIVFFIIFSCLPILSFSQDLLKTEDSDSVYLSLYPPLVTVVNSDSGSLEIVPEYSTEPIVNQTPTRIEINKFNVVDQIPINAGTTPTGAKTYSIPISVPMGISNVATPKLSLSYNSQILSGTIGESWSLSGLSSISRVPKNIYYDGMVDGCDLNGVGPFCIDGNRLIYMWGNGTTNMYKTERDHIFVEAHFDMSRALYFDVFYPNGCKAVFGYKDNVEAKLVYPITEFEDQFGNKIEYFYIVSGNVYYISKISYNNNSIDFIYEDKTSNVFSAYLGGKEIISDKLLSEIVVNIGGYALSTYTISYYESDYKYFVSEIGLSANGLKLNPIKFYYGNGKVSQRSILTGGLVSYYYTNENPERITVSRGRFDYKNSYNAIAFYPNEVCHWNVQYDFPFLSQQSIINMYNGTEKIYVYEDCDINEALWNNYFYPIYELQTGKGFIAALFADLSGSQEEYLVKINNFVYNDMDKVVFSVYEKNGIGVIERYTREFILGGVQSNKIGMSWPQPKHFKVGDFDGDGRMEILAMSINCFGNNSKCYLFDLENNKIVFESSILDYQQAFLGNKNQNPLDVTNSSDRLFVGDFNGDGKHELCHINKKNTKIYSFLSDSRSGTWSESSSIVNFTMNHETLANRNLYITDINGDGATDLLLTPLNNGTSTDWIAYFSMGDGYSFDVKYKSWISNYKSTEYGGFLFFDYNNDGVEDIVRYDNLGLRGYPSNRNWYDSNNVYGESFNGKKVFIPSSEVSRNTFSSIMWMSDGKIYKNNFSKNLATQHLCTGMSNSFGVIEHNYYDMANDLESGSCLIGNGSKYPFVDLAERFPIVSQIKTYYDGKEKNSEIYTYESPILHRHGLGLQGFKKINSYVNNKDKVSRTYDPYMRGVMTNEESEAFKNTYNYSVIIDKNKLLDIHLDSVTTIDLLKGVTVKTETQYDEYANPILVTTIYGKTRKQIQKNSYLNKSQPNNGYYQGLLSERTETTIMDAESYSEKVQYLNFVSLLPTESVSYINNNQTKHEKWLYDSHGKIISESIKNFSASNFLTKQYQYDSNHRLTSSTDYLDRKTSFTYNLRGELSEQKDFRGNITAYSYDSFGRLISTKYSDGTVTRTTNSWCNEPDKLYCTITESDNAPTVTIYYDAFNREVSKSEKQFNGEVMSVDKLYDKYGRLVKTSCPYKSDSEPSSWHKFEYDSFDRLVSFSESSGNTKSYTYLGLNQQVIEDGIETVNTYDEAGYLVNVNSNGVNVEYGYNPDGQIKAIIANDTEIQYEYDVFRRLICRNEPTLGLTTYSYDSSGNLVAETDAEGRMQEYSYDTYNRYIGYTSPEMSCEFTYDSSTGDLIKITSSTGYKKEIVYDNFGNIIKAEESISGKLIRNEYTYSGGRVESVKHTSASGFSATENYRYSNGHLYEILINGDKSICRRKAVNEFGKISSVGSSVINTEYRYDRAGYRTGLKVSNKHGMSIVDISTEIDHSARNVVARNDNVRSFEEAFEYDENNRLINSGGDGVEYDYYGNIIVRDCVGEFFYEHPSNPYAITYSEYKEAQIPRYPIAISYSSFSRPLTIRDDYNSVEFTYGPDFNRILVSSDYADGNKITQYFLSDIYEYELTQYVNPGIGVPVTRNLEIEALEEYADEVLSDKSASKGTVVERIYLGGDAYSAPAVLVKTADKENLYHLIRDHLGSIMMVIDENGGVVQELSYDAWGRLRNPDTHEYYEMPEDEPELFLRRGYCGHEHIPKFNLINMNARLYSPLLGRFMSPDPNVQDPYLPQNYNRYVYCLNNPLRYVDRDGEFWQIVVGALIGAYAGGVLSNSGELNPLAWDYNSAGTYLGIGVGAIFTYYAIYGLMNPGTISYAINFASPYGEIGIGTTALGAGTDWKFDFHWITVGGGSGSISNVKDNFEANYEKDVERINNQYYRYAGNTLSAGLATFLVLDDASVIGVLDDPLIPIALGGVAYSSWNNSDAVYRQYPNIEYTRDRDIARIKEKEPDNRPAVLYELRANSDDYYPNNQFKKGPYVYLNKDDVWKIGETTKGIKRYSWDFYLDKNVYYLQVDSGTKTEMRIREKEELAKYYVRHGHLPPGNSIFR